MTWSRPITTGESPSCRAGHTITSLNTKLFVFGGGDGTLYLNDLHVLDNETMSWSQVYVTGTTPAPRSRHTATLVGNKLYVIGGGDDSRVYNDVYILDFTTMSWTKATTSGPTPVARWGHVTVVLDNKLYLHGGHDGTRMLSDLNSLDTETLVWTSISYTGIAPTPRAGHTANTVKLGNQTKIIFFGGGDGTRILNDSFIFDADNSIFIQPTITGAAPAARCAHTTTWWEGKLLVFGGGDGSRRFKDLYVFDTELLVRYEQGKEKKPKVQVKKQEDKMKNPEEAKYKDVTMWLQSIGMRKYAEKFVREEIELNTLNGLTEAHLERMGVTTIGARLHILHAINALNEKKYSKEEETLQLLKHINKSLENLTVVTQSLVEVVQLNKCTASNNVSTQNNGLHTEASHINVSPVKLDSIPKTADTDLKVVSQIMQTPSVNLTQPVLTNTVKQI